jgi:hypothetical protein
MYPKKKQNVIFRIGHIPGTRMAGQYVLGQRWGNPIETSALFQIGLDLMMD